MSQKNPESRPEAIAKMKSLAYEAQSCGDAYLAQVNRDEFNLLAICYDIPETEADGVWSAAGTVTQLHSLRIVKTGTKG